MTHLAAKLATLRVTLATLQALAHPILGLDETDDAERIGHLLTLLTDELERHLDALRQDSARPQPPVRPRPAGDGLDLDSLPF